MGKMSENKLKKKNHCVHETILKSKSYMTLWIKSLHTETTATWAKARLDLPDANTVVCCDK